MQPKEFLDAKEKALHSLEIAEKEQKVDAPITTVLSLLNKLEMYYTSSSCAGRVMVLELPEFGDKKRAKVVGKWHRVVTFEEVEEAVKKAHIGVLWLLAQAPILHVGAESLDAADRLVKLARSCGFKNSAVKSTSKKIMVELCSTERLDAPIGVEGRILCDAEYLELLVDISNSVMERSARKLRLFEQRLRNI